MLNFPDAPAVDQEFRASPKATFKWTAAPNRWRRIPVVPIDPMATMILPDSGLINTAIPASVWGQGFTAGCKVWVQGGVELPTTFVSDAELQITMPANATAGTTKVYVVMDNAVTLPPTAGLDFTYEQPALVLTSLNPESSIQQPGVTTSVTLTGSGFIQNESWAWWNGMMASTVYISPTQLRVDSVMLSTVGTFPVYVRNQSTALQSNALNFYITSNQPPKLISVSPSTTPQGSTIVTLTVTGQNFVNGKRIVLDGKPVATTYVSATTLTTPNVLAKISYPKIKVQVEECPGELSVTCTPLPGAVPIGEVIPEVWPHSHQTNPYYGRNFLVYDGGYLDSDEVWIRDSAVDPPNWILHESWPEGGLLMFQASYLGGAVRKIFADVMVKKNGVQSGNTARLIIGGT
jgi:hypothetical protein